MSTQFQDDLKALLEIGYSPQQAEQLALNKAEGWIEHQMAILDKKFPLVNDQALLQDIVAGKSVVQIDTRAQKWKKQGGSGKSKAHGRSTTRSSSRKGASQLIQSISGSQVLQPDLA
jgi:hypothetical protein